MSMSVVVSGATGRMGGQLARLIAEAEDLRLVGGIAGAARDAGAAATAGYPVIEAPDSAGRLLEAADVLIDFSAPVHLLRLIRVQGAALQGRPLVVGTTGLGPPELAALEAVAEASPLVRAANFSVGVNLLLALVEETARRLPPADYDVEIVEAHHRRKADAPSGTALALGEAVARARDSALDPLRRDGRSGRGGERPAGEIGFHALRGGDVVGEHRVLFLGGRERLELAHAASDRTLFAAGALVAARWAVGRAPGQYTMRDVLGL